MNTRTKRTVLAGIIGTVIMTIIMKITPIMGMPKMSPPNMLAKMLEIPIVVGWIMHFIIGIVFAFIYTYLCILKHKINNIWLKGLVFGIVAFVFAQIMMGIMGAIMPMPKMENSIILTMINSLIAHIIFGIAVAKTIGEHCFRSETCNTKTV